MIHDTRSHVTNNSWTQNSNIMKTFCTLIFIQMIQSGHNFHMPWQQRTAMACVKLWPDWIIIFIQNQHIFLQDLDCKLINTLRPRQNGRHFADDILKFIFLNENVWTPIKNSLKFVPKGPINNMPTLVQIMAWRHSGDKPLSESMLVSLSTHICVTRPQWVNCRWNVSQTTSGCFGL